MSRSDRTTLLNAATLATGQSSNFFRSHLRTSVRTVNPPSYVILESEVIETFTLVESKTRNHFHFGWVGDVFYRCSSTGCYTSLPVIPYRRENLYSALDEEYIPPDHVPSGTHQPVVGNFLRSIPISDDDRVLDVTGIRDSAIPLREVGSDIPLSPSRREHAPGNKAKCRSRQKAKSKFPRKAPEKVKIDLHGGLFDIGNSIAKAKAFVDALHAALSAIAYDGSDRSIFETILSRIEDLVCVIVAITTATDIRTIIASVLLYLRTFSTKPIIERATEFLQSFSLEVKVSQQGSATDFMSFIKGGVSLWKDIDDQVFTKLSTLVDLLIVGGFAGESGNIFTGDDYDQVKRRLSKVQRKSTSFITLILDTFVFFVERGFLFLETRDPKVLLYGRAEFCELDDEYNLLVNASKLLEAGRIDELHTLAQYPAEPINNTSDFSRRLDVLEGNLLALASAMDKDTPGRNTIIQKCGMVKKMRMHVILAEREECFREAPFVVMIYGPSGVAKSSAIMLTIRSIAEGQGEVVTARDVCFENAEDKYQTEFRAGMKYIVSDDVGNTMPLFCEVAPTRNIIKFANNVPVTALKADVDSKGTVYMKPKGYIITTNDKSLNASVYSVEPASILRRMDIVLTLRLKKECTQPNGLPDPKFADQLIPDIWEVSVEKPVVIRGANGARDSIRYIDLTNNTLVDSAPSTISMHQAMLLIKSQAAMKKALQQRVLKSQLTVLSMHLCEHLLPFDGEGCCLTCSPADVKDQDGLYEDIVVHSSPDPMSEKAKEWLDANLGNFVDISLHGGYTPAEWELAYASFMKRMNREEHCARADDLYANIVGLPVTPSLRDQLVPPSEPLDPLACATPLVDWWKQHSGLILSAAWNCTIAGSFVAVAVSLYNFFRPSLETHGSEEVIRAPNEVHQNPWISRPKLSLSPAFASKSATVQQVLNKVEKLQGVFNFTSVGGSVRWSNICPLRGNLWILPQHITDDIDFAHPVHVRCTESELIGKNFKCWLTPSHIWDHPTKDFSVVRLIAGGDVPDLSKWLPVADVRISAHDRVQVLGVFRDENYMLSLIDGKVVGNCSKVVQDRNYEIIEITYSQPTRAGMCCSPLITNTSTPVIAGFHICGVTGGPRGFILCFNQTDMNDALSYFEDNGQLLCPSTGDIPETRYDKVMHDGGDVSPKNPIHHIDKPDFFRKPPNYEVIGTAGNRATKLRSSVVKYDWSDALSKVVPCLHGRVEQSQQWRHFQKAMSGVATPMDDLPPIDLELAYEDFSRPIFDHLSNNYDLEREIYPLPDSVNMSGLNGSFGGIDLKTSCGYPLNKPKHDYFERTGLPTIDSDGNVAITDTVQCNFPEIFEEMAKAEEMLAQSKRCHMIFKMALKDEAKPLEKVGKIRVMSVASIHDTLLIRKYFVTIIDLLHKNRIIYECAVGCNVRGEDWSQIVNHLTQFGENTAGYVAGDYSSYDKHQCPALILKAMSFYIEIARMAGFNARQLKIMSGIAHEIAYPTYEMQGLIFSACGSNPSGNPLTVEINSVVNSLLLRFVFIEMSRKLQVPLVPFRSVVALTVYGDDNAAGVCSSHAEVFNNVTISEVLTPRGLVYTPPSKGGDLIKLYPFDELTYLKRKALYCPYRKTWVAALDTDSLCKSFHFCMRPKPPQTERMTFEATVYNNFQELSYWGPEIYNDWRERILSVREEIGFPHLDILTFDQQIAPPEPPDDDDQIDLHGAFRIARGILFDYSKIVKRVRQARRNAREDVLIVTEEALTVRERLLGDLYIPIIYRLLVPLIANGTTYDVQPGYPVRSYFAYSCDASAFPTLSPNPAAYCTSSCPLSVARYYMRQHCTAYPSLVSSPSHCIVVIEVENETDSTPDFRYPISTFFYECPSVLRSIADRIDGRS